MSNQNDDVIDTSKRQFLLGATTVVGGLGIAATAVPFLASWQPSERAQAAGAPVEVDVSQLAPGYRITVEWRGKPVWVVRRTQAMLDTLDKDTSMLRDPKSETEQQPEYAQNIYRALKPELFVVVGICTHLGCSPLFKPEAGSVQPDWPGGFFCPCHGSKYDLSGRVFKGVPAPLNLPVPPYKYLSDNVILIGDDSKDAS